MGPDDLLLSGVRMGTGTWSWGDRLLWGYGSSYNEGDVHAAFEVSIQEGITFFDTAEIYGQGKSEELLGSFIASTEASVRVATKFMPYPWRLSRRALLKALQGSLARLRVERVDLYQMHTYLPPLPIQTWMEAMAEAHQRGLIAGVGVSNYNREQTQQAYDALTRLGVPLASNQVEYSLLNRNAEKDGLVRLCRDLGIALIAYSPLAMGVLTGKYSPEKPLEGFRSRRYSREHLVRAKNLLQELRKIGAANGGKTIAQVALNWVIQKGFIPIPGAKNAEQARENAGALLWQLSEEEVARLDELSDGAAAGKKLQPAGQISVDRN